MRPLSALFATALLGVGAGACGSGSSASSASRPAGAAAATGSTAATAASGTTSTQDYTRVDSDKDNDVAGPFDDKNNNGILDYARPASAADTRAITALIERYYKTAVAGDGARACSMMYITLAEAIPEDQGHGSAGPPYLSQGTTCPSVMNLFFRHLHSQLATELPLLKVTRVRLNHHHGLAVLSFGAMPERQINVRREKRTWKLAGMIDNELP